MRKPFNGGHQGNRGGNKGGSGENRFKSEVLVRSLPFKASEGDIEEHFGQFGQIGSLNLLKNPDGTSKGICFVRFDEDSAMQQAIDSSGADFMGRKIVVEKTKPREERDTGSFGGRGGERGGRDFGDRRDNFRGRDNRDNDFRGGRDARDGGRDRRDRDDHRERSRERERRDDRGSGGSQSKTIFVGNLNFSTSEDALREFFEDCGGIKDVRITTKPDGSSKGFAHIEFNDEKACQKALKRNDEKVEGRRIRVDVAQGRKNQQD
jgi:RNA recognition motif-containing protein